MGRDAVEADVEGPPAADAASLMRAEGAGWLCAWGEVVESARLGGVPEIGAGTVADVADAPVGLDVGDAPGVDVAGAAGEVPPTAAELSASTIAEDVEAVAGVVTAGVADAAMATAGTVSASATLALPGARSVDVAVAGLPAFGDELAFGLAKVGSWAVSVGEVASMVDVAVPSPESPIATD